MSFGRKNKIITKLVMGSVKAQLRAAKFCIKNKTDLEQ